MIEDADGNQITVGYEGMLMFKVTNILNNGTLIWQGGLNDSQTVTTLDGTNAHKGQTNWPGVPGA